MTTLTHRKIIHDYASQLAYAGATDFDGVPHQEYALAYNESGSLVSDEGRNIANIEYDNLNNPVRIQFTNGNVTKYVYSVAGEKLRVTYQTAVPNITVAMGSTRELTPSETLYTDSIDYLLGGALTLRNGRIDKYQFDEGYCQAERYTSTKDDFTFCYYDKDHLGNVRQVTELDGTSKGDVIQKNNYYPFGAEFCENLAKSYVQRHKYNGKEFDRMHGLNTYDYGARQYNPVTARWDRIDPLAHEYYGVSPYVYCMNNPVKFVDPDGRDIKFIEGTSKAFIEKYSMARQYLIENGCGQLIELFEKDKKLTLLIGERANGTSSGFSPNRNCIFVDLDKGITSTDSNGNRHFLSPAVVLIHEFDHAWAFNYDKDGYDERTQKKDPLYGDMEEKRVIEGKETETARNLGEINEDEMSRDSHGAVPFTAVSPISNEPINKK